MIILNRTDMSFKYSAFIENSQEAREWLESIGYEPCPCVGDDPQDLIFTDHERGKFHGYDKETYGDILAEREQIGGDEVDCREHLPLFRAVTAITDEHDNNQWFVSKDNEFIMCWQSELKHVVDNYYEEYSVSDFHKASLEELINHFKSKSNGI